MPCASVVVSGHFCRFKLALPSLFSMSFDMDNSVARLSQVVAGNRFFRKINKHLPSASGP